MSWRLQALRTSPFGAGSSSAELRSALSFAMPAKAWRRSGFLIDVDICVVVLIAEIPYRTWGNHHDGANRSAQSCASARTRSTDRPGAASGAGAARPSQAARRNACRSDPAHAALALVNRMKQHTNDRGRIHRDAAPVCCHGVRGSGVHGFRGSGVQARDPAATGASPTGSDRASRAARARRCRRSIPGESASRTAAG